MKYGPTFVIEIEAAGLRGKPFTWGEPNPAKPNDDGIDGWDNLSDADQATLRAVIAAHNPDAVPDHAALDLADINRALIEPGSILRAIAEIQFGMIKGTIPVTPSLTVVQYRRMIRDRMRT